MNGTRLAYAVDGDGPPVVIVHGAWGDYRSFREAVPVLAREHKVIRLSLRQHWPNSAPQSRQEANATYSIDTHISDLAAFIQSLGVGKVDLLGHSYGGLIAAAVAQRHPALVRRLVLIEPSLVAILRDRPDGPRVLAEWAQWRDETLAILRAGASPESVLMDYYDEDAPGLFQSFPAARRSALMDNARTTEPVFVNFWGHFPFSCGDASDLGMPVLLVEGEKTGRVMHEIVSRLRECLPNSNTVVLPGASHRIQWDAPVAMASVVEAFLSTP